MLFGVLDGHGGKQVSRFVAKFFSNVMKRLSSYKRENYHQALLETFINLDELLKDKKIDNLLKTTDLESLTNQNIIDVISTIETKSNSSSFDNKDKSYKDKTFEKSFRSISPVKDLLFLESKKVNNVSYYDNNEKNEEDLIKLSKYSTLSPSNNNEIKEFSFHPINLHTFNETESKERSSLVNLENLLTHNMGTTAVIVFVMRKVFYIANVGDSRAVLFKGGKAIRLNEEHKPSLVSEQSRIKKAGFNLISNRIDGKLNLTRAIGNLFIIIGDFIFKNNSNLKRHEQAVTVYPEVNKIKITKDMEFIIIACDGVWDCVDEDKLCEYVHKNLKEKKPISEIISTLFDKIISKTSKCKKNLK